MTATLQHLRWVETPHLVRYFAEQADTLDFIAQVHGFAPESHTLTGDYTIYHSWLPGFLGASRSDVEALAAARRAGGPFEVRPAELEERGWTRAGTPDLDALVRRTLVSFPAIQNPVELRSFLALVAGRPAPRVTVEIGTAAGWVFFCLSQLTSADDGVLVSIDVPASGDDEKDRGHGEVFKSFAPPGQRVELIRDRSFHHTTREDLRRILDGRSIDLLLIDGDHSYGGVRSDFEMYAPLVGKGGLVAFHDICMHPSRWGRGNDVAIFWSEVAQGRQTTELVDPNGSLEAPRFDTPVGFRMPALGFGVVAV